VLFAIASGKPGFSPGNFAANGFGDHSPCRYSLESAILAEGVLTFMFLMISSSAPPINGRRRALRRS
jgi:aquaporin Z